MKLQDIFTIVPTYLDLLHEDHGISLDSTDIPDFNPRYSKIVGTFDNKDVWASRYYPGHHVFAFIEQEQLMAFIVIKDNLVNNCHPLTRLWSTPSKNTIGYITALVLFVLRKLQLPLIITPDEPLTTHGWNWLIKNVKREKIIAYNQNKIRLTADDIFDDKLKNTKTTLSVILESHPSNFPIFGNGYRQLSEPNLVIGDIHLS